MQTTYDLTDYVEFLQALDEEGFEFTVIGGCAVGAYAHLRGEAVLSKDLDIYVSEESLGRILQWTTSIGATVVKRPQPRSIFVAVIDWRGKPIDALTRAPALPDASSLARNAREFSLSGHGGLTVPIADPFDLIANKVAVGREQDVAHVAILRAFVDEEIATNFAEEHRPRHRIRAARRLMEVLGQRVLPESLAARLVPLANDTALRRFLVHHVPFASQARSLIDAAPVGERTVLQRILDARGFD